MDVGQPNPTCLLVSAAVLLSILAILLLPAASCADSLISLDDFESSSPWPGTRIVESPVHSGTRALAWNVADRPGPNGPSSLRDWTRFDELRFWAYLPLAVDFTIPIVFPAQGGYYRFDWKLDWRGWKEHRISLADCTPVHEPAGWNTIRGIGFRAQGYGQPPVPEGLRIVFDDFALHTQEDMTGITVDDLIVKERKERVAMLKASGNPYYQSIYEHLEGTKAEPDLPADMPSSWSLAGITTRALERAWAAAYDDSPLKGNEALIAHAIALVDYALEQQKDGSWFYAREWKSRADPNSDRFALGPLMDAVYWLRRLPEMDENWLRWDNSLRELVDFQYDHWGHYAESGRTDNIAWGSAAFTYPNQDVFYLYVMALAHAFWNEDRYRAEVVRTLDGLEAHLLPNGGLNYIGPETEIPTYHDLNVAWIARYFDLTRDDRARALLEATTPYYPSVSSNEGRPEYYTDCWWKHYWGDGKAAGPEIIAGITGDARNKWLANRLLERTGTGTTYWAIYAGTFYRDDIAEQPLDDNWLIHDENIRGPRGRFGKWHFAGSPGGGARDTWVGAMVCDETGRDPLKGALLAATIEVAQPEDDRGRNQDLYISGHDDIFASAIDGDMAVLGARYSLRKPYINSVEGREVRPTPWKGTQLWLLTRHGLVGLLELDAEQELTVPSLKAEVRLGPLLPVREAGPATWRVGPLAATILESSFPEISSSPARPPYAQSESKHDAILLRTSGSRHTALPGKPVHYAVLVAPADAAPISDFTRFDHQAGLAFQINIDGTTVTATFDATTRTAGIDLSP